MEHMAWGDPGLMENLDSVRPLSRAENRSTPPSLAEIPMHFLVLLESSRKNDRFALQNVEWWQACPPKQDRIHNRTQ